MDTSMASPTKQEQIVERRRPILGARADVVSVAPGHRRTAAGEGVKTVVIEGGEEVGGLCILRGCLPSKALLYAAEVMHLASHPEPWGIQADASVTRGAYAAGTRENDGGD